MIRSFGEVVEKARGKGSKRIVVAGAEDIEAVRAVKDAFEEGIGEGVLIGEPSKIAEVLGTIGKDNFVKNIIPVFSEEEKGHASVEEVKKGGILLKGDIKTSTLLRAVLNKEWGLRTEKIISDVLVFEDTREEGRLVILSDGGVNVKPDFTTLLSIIENSVNVAHVLGIETPLVALLSANESVSLDMEETIIYSMIAKMNERGQIKNCVVDGPLALDNAISLYAAQKKGIKSSVAGNADILIVPNIVAGNLLGKAINYYAKFKNAHIIVGAKAVILIPSRADQSDVKFYSIALAQIYNKI